MAQIVGQRVMGAPPSASEYTATVGDAEAPRRRDHPAGDLARLAM